MVTSDGTGNGIEFDLQDVVVDGYDFSLHDFTAVKGSVIQRVVFRKCVFHSLDFDWGEYTDVFFEECTFRSNSYLGSYTFDKTQTVRFVSCIFDGHLRLCNDRGRARGIELEKCVLTHGAFSGDGYRVSKCRFTTGCNLMDSDNSVFRNIEVPSVKVEGVSNLRFSSVDVISDITLVRSIVESTFQDTQAAHLVMSGASVSDTKFWNCVFDRRNFEGASLHRVDFAHTFVTEDDFAEVHSMDSVTLVCYKDIFSSPLSYSML